MHVDYLLREAFLELRSFFEGSQDPILPAITPTLIITSIQPSSISKVVKQSGLATPTITPAPELRLRNPLPAPQDDGGGGDDCSSEASRSASQAIQQASQQASESIRQASQSASQAAQQASQTASNQIREAQNSASQSIAAASRSLSSVSSSASSAVSAAQSSAGQAISNARESLRNAQFSASDAVRQAGAAEATLSSEVGQAPSENQQASNSPVAGITATQAALAIVGSIIASTLITILIYFLVIRHKRLVRKKALAQKTPGSPKGGNDTDSEYSHPDTHTRTEKYEPARTQAIPRKIVPNISFSKFHDGTSENESSRSRGENVKSTSVSWNPANPPKAPSLGSWLKLQDGVSPFGPIKLSLDEKKDAPLGGQLKSPHRSMDPQNQPLDSSFRGTNAPEMSGAATDLPQKYRESKASLWTDDVPDNVLSPRLQSKPRDSVLISPKKGYAIAMPSPQRPVRSTAEWLTSREDQIRVNSPKDNQSSYSTPRNSRPGLPSGPGSNRQQSQTRHNDGYRRSAVRLMDAAKAAKRQSHLGTPGVGKAM